MSLKEPPDAALEQAALEQAALEQAALEQAALEQGEQEQAAQEQAELEADRQLAQRCVAGEVTAWEECYALWHDPLVASVRELLGERSSDGNLVDEIAAQVWYALVENDGKLLTKYDPARGGRLKTFMRAIAKGIVLRHLRSERRRLGHERRACHGKLNHHPADQEQVETSVGEFLGTLAPRERRFCDEHLLGASGDPSGDGEGGENGESSRADFWQRTRRIYKRLLGFLGGGV